MVNKLGWGRQSNQQIASKYDKAWLDHISDGATCLKTGFALYDAKRYDDALAVFKKMEETADGDPDRQAMAIIWQGHMLDLLGKRETAISKYKRVAEMSIDSGVRHDQYGLAYEYTPYAKERMTTPFVRVENQTSD
jgi:tetratricopeptide (TPR) repeat protein